MTSYKSRKIRPINYFRDEDMELEDQDWVCKARLILANYKL